MVSMEQMALVKASLPRFQRAGYEVAVELYREVFRVDAGLRNLFSLEFLTPKAVGGGGGGAKAPAAGCPFAGADSLMEPLSMQARILAQTVVELAASVDDLGACQSTIDRICNKHVSRDIRAEHYGVVAAAFAAAMRTVLGEEFSEEEHAAWNAAIAALAAVFIARETAVREEAGAREGGWVGFRQFVVLEQLDVGLSSTKFVLVPKDGKAVCAAGRGHFSCVRMQVDGFGTVYHNTVLHSPATRQFTAVTETTSNVRSGSAAARGGTAVDADYGTVISRAADRAPPPGIAPEVAEVMVAPGRLISERATPGAVLELSVPVGGGSAVDMNEENSGRKAGGGGSLLRNALGQGGGRTGGGAGSPLLRQAALAGRSPLGGSPAKQGSRLQGVSPLSPTGVFTRDAVTPEDAVAARLGRLTLPK